jgi:hypothetical protein
MATKSKSKAENYQWTKERINKVITVWDSKTKKEMCEILGCEPGNLSYISMVIRKAGYPLTRKSSKGYLYTLVKETLKEHGYIKK